MEQQGKNTSCAPGYKYVASSNACVESVASRGTSKSLSKWMTAALDGRKATCPVGFMRGPDDADGAPYQCLECPDLQVCLVHTDYGAAQLEN
jgi:hypothetical protein